MEMDNNDDPWNFHKCKLCNYRTRYIPKILSHVRLHRTRSKSLRFICHLHSPEKYQCEECQFQSDDKVLLTIHFNTIHKTEETQHYYLNPIVKNCENCDFQTYSSLVLLSHHNLCDETGNHIFQTSQTGKYCQLERTDEHSNLEMRQHFECSHCSYKTTTKQCLKTHVLQRHTPKEEINWLNCEHCSYKAKQKWALRQHILCKHIPEEEINWANCEHCSYKGKTKRALRRHFFKIHCKPVVDKLDEFKRFKCDRCFYEAINEQSLRRHILQKHPLSKQINWPQCKHCPYKAKWKSRLLDHNRRRHGEASDVKKYKRFKCNHCAYIAETSTYLKKHILWKHTPEEEIIWLKCEHCSFKSKHKQTLSNHLLRHHSNPSGADQSATFKCDQSSSLGKRKTESTKHKRRKRAPQNAIKWLKCEMCSYKDKDEDGLLDHVLMWHLWHL